MPYAGSAPDLARPRPAPSEPEGGQRLRLYAGGLNEGRAPRALEPDLTPDQLDAALSGDTAAMRALVRFLRPVVQAEVGWTLQRHRPHGTGRDPRQEMSDVVQEVFLALLENDGRILRAWAPERGRKLRSFVGLVARHQVLSILRSGRRCPWTEEPTPVEALGLPPSEHLEDQLANADEARRILHRLERELDPRSLLLFEGLYVEQRSVEEVCDDHGLTRDALYAWRSRLRRKVRALVRRMRRSAR